MAQTPEQIAQKWSQNLGSATQRITDGINAVTVSPGQAAARQATAYQQNVVAAVPKWKANVAAVSLDSWKSDAINKGVPRIASGATAAQPKFQQFIGQLLPHINQVRGTLQPRGDLEANIARMTTFVRGMSKFRYNRAGG